jgi:hypothetical protein
MEKYVCPNCKTKNAIRIVYGYPGKEMLESARKDEISLGGCIIQEDSPDRYCKNCKEVWNSSQFLMKK